MLVVVLLICCSVVLNEAQQTQLLQNWRVQNSAHVTASPQAISKVGFDDSSWYPTVVPANGTVMATLLYNNVYSNLTYGTNLQQVQSKQFSTPWWYRTEFPVNGKYRSTVTFKGINYRANIWVDGRQIGNSSYVMGTFDYFTFEIRPSADTVAFAVEVYKPNLYLDGVSNLTGLDLAITFVDWSVPTPDANMGLWQDVVLKSSGPVTIAYPMVETTLNSQGGATLRILADLTNLATDGSTSGTLTAVLSEIGTCFLNVRVPASSTQSTFITADQCAALNVKNPKLWWPAQMGNPYLYNLTLTFSVDGVVSDSLQTPFGIRQITDELMNGHRLYKINGLPILIRGAGWSPDLFQRTDPDRQEIEIQYTLHMNLNAIRLEGKFENDHLFDLADRYGVLMLPGICCCDAWQAWKLWKDEQRIVAAQSIATQAKRLRIHPSVLVFLYSSDELPPQSVEQMYLDVFHKVYWPNPLLSSAADAPSKLTGPSGVKMSGPYSWVPPNYWLLDNSSVGGAFGFLTEGGPGESPMTWQSLTLTIPPNHYWPIDSVWNYHCGAYYGSFATLSRFTDPLNARYGTAKSVADYVQKSQLATYEGQRAMFEGYSRNKYDATGVIQWMLNNPFSEMIWHLYDIYLDQGGGYYGSKKACEPLHIMYSYNDGSIWIVNSLYQTVPAVAAKIAVYNINGGVLFTKTVNAGPFKSDSAVPILTLPEISGLTSTYFLRLNVTSTAVTEASENVYWLSTKKDVLNWSKSTWYNTPCTAYADFTLLETLPKVTLTKSFSSTETKSGDILLTATVVNTSPRNVAFFVHVRAVRAKSGTNVLPIFWDDNYVTIFPNEQKTFVAQFSKADLHGEQPDLVVEAVNY